MYGSDEAIRKRKANMQALIDSLKAVAGKAQFASFTYKTKEKFNAAGKVVDGGEVARYTLILGAEYQRLLEKSLLALDLLDIGELAKQHPAMSLDLFYQAKTAVKESLEKSLIAHKQGTQNADYTKRGLYEPLGGGLNLNKNDLTLQMFGLLKSKVVLSEGIKKTVNSAPLTIAKNIIKRELPISKFLEFALDMGNIKTVKLNGQTVEIE